MSINEALSKNMAKFATPTVRYVVHSHVILAVVQLERRRS